MGIPLAVAQTAAGAGADGMLYLMGDVGDVALLWPNPERRGMVSQFSLPEGGRGAAYARLAVRGWRLHSWHADNFSRRR